MARNKTFRLALTCLLFIGISLSIYGQSPTLVSNKKAVEAGFSAERLERLDSYFRTKAKEGELPGGVCLVYRKGVLAHEMVFGYGNAEEKTSMQADQIFYIQSMTKPIISVALMTLYEEGHFLLNDPIAKYLPQFNSPQVLTFENGEEELVPAKTPITIAQCLSHTAGFLHGLSDNPLDKRYAKALYGIDDELQPENLNFKPHETIEDRVNALAELPLAAQPDQVWMYSAAPDVLALLIEHFSGKPVDQFLQERIFGPLGMKDSGYNLTDEQTKRMVSVHLQAEDGQQSLSPSQTETSGNTVFGGTHGLFSTAADYMKFAQMLLNKGELNGTRILGRKTVELMTTDHAKHRFQGSGAGFGLGFGVRTDLADGKSLGSEGQFYWGGMFNTYFFVDPEEDLTAVLMMQFFPYTDFYNNKFRQFVYQAIVD